MKKVVFFLFALGFIATLFAHSGRTDSQGCHTDSRTGIYHCH
jgi:hypothetical protein